MLKNKTWHNKYMCWVNKFSLKCAKRMRKMFEETNFK